VTRKGTPEFRIAKLGEQQLLLKVIDRGVDLERKIDGARQVLELAIQCAEQRDRVSSLALMKRATGMLALGDRETAEETFVVNRFTNELAANTGQERKRRHALRRPTESQMVLRVNARNKLLTMRKRAPHNSHTPKLSEGETSTPRNPKQ
jgi:hypothetical protein